MCLIHLRPTRVPSPDPVVPSRPITRTSVTIPAPPLSSQSFRRTSRPTSTSQLPHSPRASDLKRLSIQSREQWEATRRKEAERERERTQQQEMMDREYELQPMMAPAAPRQQTVQPPAAPDPPIRRQSQRRIISFQPQQQSQERVAVLKDDRTPRSSGTRIMPDTKRESGYSYGEGPVPTSVGSLVTPGAMGPPLSVKATSNGMNTTTGNRGEVTRPQKPPHRRRESSVSVMNGRDGSVLERTTSGQLQVGGHHRAASLSAPQRPNGRPRRSTGNVSVGSASRASVDWGKDPRASARSVRERIVVVDEVNGTRRREYVRYEG